MSSDKPTTRCAIYTRKATDAGRDGEFGSIHDQRAQAEVFIEERRADGWKVAPERYDDVGHSGAAMDRPALQRLLADARAGVFQVVVVFAVDRLTRRLGDFSRIARMLREAGVSLMSVTQPLEVLLHAGLLPEGGRP